jgi:hypothetical protein
LSFDNSGNCSKIKEIALESLHLLYGVVREDRDRIIQGRGRVVMKGAVVISCFS